METCEGCKKEFTRTYLMLVDGKPYCVDCVDTPLKNLFNKLRSLDMQRVNRREEKVDDSRPKSKDS